jgi:hypothetical protein
LEAAGVSAAAGRPDRSPGLDAKRQLRRPQCRASCPPRMW